MKSIFTHPVETKEASKYIYKNIKNCYINTIGDNSYYHINGIVWKVWQSGTGNYPTSEGILLTNFKYQ